MEEGRIKKKMSQKRGR